MVLRPTIIWADVSFYDEQRYQSMKDDFRQNTADEPSESQQRDSLDAILCDEIKKDLRENGAIFITVHSPEEAMENIKEHDDKTVFFISSGSLGQTMIPKILRKHPKVTTSCQKPISNILNDGSQDESEDQVGVTAFESEPSDVEGQNQEAERNILPESSRLESGDQESELELVRQYPQIHSCYIYCFDMAAHCEWAIDYLEDLKMFDHQLDLLFRLTREISHYFLKRGKIYLQDQEPNDALICFNHAKILETRCNTRDKLNMPFMERLNILGDKNNGLIQRALQMIQKHDKEPYVKESEQHKIKTMREQSPPMSEIFGDTAVLFLVGSVASSSIDLESNLVKLIPSYNDDQVKTAVAQLASQQSFSIVSSQQPSTDLLSHKQLFRYYSLVETAAANIQSELSSSALITYVDSIERLTSELYNDLGQYYREKAQQAFTKHQDRIEAKRLLAKSTRCYEILAEDAEKTLKQYTDILKPQHGDK